MESFLKLLLVLLFTICTSAFAQNADYFNTQVNDDLSITGSHCRGGGRFSVRPCTDGEWYVTLTHKTAGSTMFLGALDRADIVSASTLTFYTIRALTPVSKATQKIINRYLVRFDLNGEPMVIDAE